MTEKFQNRNEFSGGNIDPLDGGINFKSIIGKFLAFIPYFIFSILFTLTVAFLINRYSTPRYLVKGSILIKEKGGRAGIDGADNFLQGMQLLSTSRNIENEQGIIKSKSLVQSTIRQLNFGISYFSQGSIKKTDLFGNLPFLVELDSQHVQILGAEISLNFINEKEVEVWVERGGELFIPVTSEKVKPGGVIEKRKYNLKDLIVSENFSFRIKILDPTIIGNATNFYSFRLNSFEGIVNEYYNSYSLRPINKLSSIIEISKEGRWPEKDKAFIDELCRSYIRLGMDEKNRVTQNTIRFIDLQLLSIGDTLGRVENQLQDFRSENKIIDLSANGSNIINSLGNLEERKAEQDLKNKYFEYLEKYVKNSNPLDELIAPSLFGINEPTINVVLQKMIELYSKRKALSISYQPNNPILIETDQALTNLKLTLLENIKSVKIASKIFLDDINLRISSFDKEISELPKNEQKLLKMTRKYQLSDKLYTYLLEKRAEAGIAGAGINPDNKIIDEAEITERTFPKTTNNYLVALAIGLILPLLILLALDFFNHNIQNHSQLQGVSKLPLVGSIVHNTKTTALVIANHPKSQVSESFRNLRSNISYLRGNDSKKVIMVTSTVSGEGKTFISMNLSSVLAIGGYRTLLIGVDLRKPKIFQDFKLDNSFGLTNYLIGKANKDDIIQKTDLNNLFIVTAGPTPPNPSELIMSHAFYDLIEEYKKQFDFIVLDTPPIGLVADGLDIMKHSDIILYVARQNVTKKNYLNLINEIYSSENDKNIGLIFNDVNFAAIYGYGYGSYGYGYGYGYGGGYSYGYGSTYGYGYGSQYGYGDTELEKKSFWVKLLGR
jgi:tyrosine-protein kinase Etk/Wzc